MNPEAVRQAVTVTLENCCIGLACLAAVVAVLSTPLWAGK